MEASAPIFNKTDVNSALLLSQEAIEYEKKSRAP